ncbi:MAG: prepilin-type N-terminal cleavage/methylation domain-containing protein [Bdellovibrionaceae bacterium]|nr:prepilin-type N-terminal cleavage/methylation domain-containing protein [Pseudobdellovibrionaceae bacterium]
MKKKRNNHSVGPSVFNQRGFGLLEVLASLGIVAVLAGATVMYSRAINTVSSPTYSKKFNCTAHAASFMAAMRSVAGATAISGFHAFQSTRTPLNTYNYSPIISGVPTNIVMPDQLGTGNKPLAGNLVAIHGMMHMLNGLYNSLSPDYCNNFVNTPGITQLANDSSAILRNSDGAMPVTSIRVRTYNLRTGAVAACWRPSWLAPPGIDNAAKNGFSQGVFTKPSTIRNDQGLLLEVQTNYRDETGQTQTCTMSQRFAYDEDTREPATPTLSIQNITPYPPSDSSPANRNQVSMRVHYPAGAEKGVALVCRDYSYISVPANQYRCYDLTSTGPGPQPSGGSRPAPRTMALPPPGYVPSSATTPVAPTDWRPCEQVTLCGRAPSATSLVADSSFTSTGEIQINNTYSNVPSDCVIRLQTAVIDSAGNLNASTITPYPGVQVTSGITATGGPGGSNTITPRPTCGNWCAATRWSTQTYWQTRACCVGLGCQIGMENGTRRQLVPTVR